MQAADRSAEGASDAKIAQEFRVSQMSANRWRRTRGPCLRRNRRGGVLARRRPAHPPGAGPSERTDCLRLVRPALDPGPNRRGGQAPVPRELHRGRGVLSAASAGLELAGPLSPRRRTRREGCCRERTSSGRNLRHCVSHGVATGARRCPARLQGHGRAPPSSEPR